MGNLSRRSVLHTSLAAVAAGTLARPYLANAAATTAEVWWAQGFVPEEDLAIKKIVADYEKASGNTIDLTALHRSDNLLALRRKRRDSEDLGCLLQFLQGCAEEPAQTRRA